MIAYHFVGEKLRDGSPVPPDGKWLRFKGIPTLCVRGLHASVDPFDALQYAPGCTLCLVEVPDPSERVSNRSYKGAATIVNTDKLVSVARRIIKRADFRGHLCRFGRMQALKVINLQKAPEVVVEFLKTGDEKILPLAWEAVKPALRSKQMPAWVQGNGPAWKALHAVVINIHRSSYPENLVWVARQSVSYLKEIFESIPTIEAECRKEFNALVREAFS